MNRKAAPALALAILIGGAIWAPSPWLTGFKEPWDAESFFYVGALLAGGVVAGVAIPKPLWAHYAGSVLGQALYGFLFLPTGPLFVLGLGFLLAFSLLFLAGAIAGSGIRRFFDARAPAPGQEP